VACASCHDPERAFSDSRPVPIGVFNRVGHRNVPALINRGYGRAFFWDGRAATLEEQVLQPIQDPNEMDMTLEEASAVVGLSVDEMSRSLASFVRSLLFANSAFDRYTDRRRWRAIGGAAGGAAALRRQGGVQYVPLRFEL
jgi:cytochrome c peroxidase